MPKLTLNVDARVVTRAKQYARTRGTSVSSLVESLLDLAAGPPAVGEQPPVLARLRGSLKKGSRRDYHRYLEQKFR